MTGEDKLIVRWLSIVYRLGQSFLDKELKLYNLGSGQGMFLAGLLHRDGISQEHLSALLCIDKGTTARAIKKLEEEGYVLREATLMTKGQILLGSRKSTRLSNLF